MCNHTIQVRLLIYNHPVKTQSRFVIFQEGAVSTTSYGLAIAKTVQFPVDIMTNATVLNEKFLRCEKSQNIRVDQFY